jgi:PAS domain S-box-containing protein
MPVNQSKVSSHLCRIKIFGWCLGFSWALSMGGSLIVNLNAVSEEIHTIAHYQALANFNKDLAIRHWSASHGGVYVPASEITPPNPHLVHISRRDVEIHGKKYTLMNPAYMIRQLNEQFSQEYGVTGHITSLNPLRADNAPDEWERKALQSFEDGAQEVMAYTIIGGKPFLRLMRPMKTEESCLKCHAHQGYKIGDIRGGVGVALPLDDLLKIGTNRKQKIIIWHLLLMSLGLGGICFGTIKLFNQAREKEKISHSLKERVKIQKEAENSLQKSKEEWEKTFNAITDIVTLQNTDMAIVKINKAGCDSLSLPCENILGHHCYELFHGSDEPCPECPLLVTHKTFEPYTKEMTHEKMGKTFLVSAAPVLDDQGNLTHIAHVAKDITEKKKIEERLFLNEKLSTIAGLAAGVAHEINTPLSGILQSQQIIEMRLDPDKPLNQERAAECGVDLIKVDTYFKNNEITTFMKGMRDSAITAGNIIKNLLEFSRPHKDEIKNAILSNLLDTTLELARSDYDLKRRYDILNVAIVKEYDPELTEVPCVAMEVEQVLLNLIKNAVHAMTDNKTENPCITVRTVKTEEMARIEVEDNGPGIDEETQFHIFDPFFTTKEVGRGTGLGLSVSHALVVDKHRGNIWVESEIGKGAKFVIELPLRQDF